MEIQIGKVTHYFNRLGVAVLELNSELNCGDSIHILGRTTDFTQSVGSMEVEHQKIQSASIGLDVAIKVENEVRKGDTIFKIVEK
jgi:putative protease